MTALLNFEGRTVVITGAASGMGAATTALLAQAGAEVYGLDVAPIDRTVHSREVVFGFACDLGDPSSIDAAVAALPARIDAVMNCAGVPNGGRFSPLEVMRINWFGLRHLTESLLCRIPDGGSIVHIASTAGRGWADRAEVHRQLMATESFDAGCQWAEANLDVIGDGYAFSKEAVQYYTMWRSVQTLEVGVRMNSICPGITDTAIMADFRKGMGDELIDRAEAIAGRMAQPSEMAPAMLFLADHGSSSYINGVNLNIDRGTGAARATGQDQVP